MVLLWSFSCWYWCWFGVGVASCNWEDPTKNRARVNLFLHGWAHFPRNPLFYKGKKNQRRGKKSRSDGHLFVKSSQIAV
jgi:hypothetical protein